MACGVGLFRPTTLGLVLVAAVGALASNPRPRVVVRKQFWRKEDRGSFNDGPVLKIGSPVSMSVGSKHYNYGRGYLNAWDLFFDGYFSNHGGIRVNGTKYAVELVLVDSESNEDKVRWATQDYSSSLTRPQAQLVNDAGKVVVTGGSSVPDVFLNRPNVFGMRPPADTYMEGAIRLVGRADNRSRKTMWLGVERDSGREELSRKVPDWAVEETVELLNNHLFPEGVTDFEANKADWDSARLGLPDLGHSKGVAREGLGVPRLLDAQRHLAGCPYVLPVDS